MSAIDTLVTNLLQYKQSQGSEPVVCSIDNLIAALQAGNALGFASAGNFLPTVLGTTVAGVNTYSAQSGTWNIVGNMCFLNFNLTASALDGAMSGNLRLGIDNAPQQVALIGGSIASGSFVNSINYSGLTFAAGYTQANIRCVAASTSFLLRKNGSAVSDANILVSEAAAPLTIIGSIAYPIA